MIESNYPVHRIFTFSDLNWLLRKNALDFDILIKLQQFPKLLGTYYFSRVTAAPHGNHSIQKKQIIQGKSDICISLSARNAFLRYVTRPEHFRRQPAHTQCVTHFLQTRTRLDAVFYVTCESQGCSLRAPIERKRAPARASSLFTALLSIFSAFKITIFSS